MNGAYFIKFFHRSVPTPRVPSAAPRVPRNNEVQSTKKRDISTPTNKADIKAVQQDPFEIWISYGLDEEGWGPWFLTP
jgi:hypothetical protein